jgi:hypothetical protein
MALRRSVFFSSPPSGTVRLEPEFYGDCLVKLAGCDEGDFQSHLVLRRADGESFLDASFNGRSEILVNLADLKFERLPIGRYVLGLFRENPFPSAGTPYEYKELSVRPCQESVVSLKR